MFNSFGMKNTYCQMSVISLGAHSLFSFSTIAKPPTAYNTPSQLTRLTELLSCGSSGKGDHLSNGIIHIIESFPIFLTQADAIEDLHKGGKDSHQYSCVPVTASGDEPTCWFQSRRLHTQP